jgi:predicted MFS family arabinose efflux permease
VGTALFASSPLTRRAPRSDVRRSRAGALASGPLRVLLGSIVLTGLGYGAVSVGLTAAGVHAGSRQSSGVLLALLGAGSMLGGVVYGGRRWTWAHAGRYRALFLILAACVAPLVAVHSLPAAYPLALLAGVCWAPLLSCQYTLVGRAAPAGSVTEAFTWMVAAFAVGVASGSALGGGLVDAAGVGAPFALVCACGGLAAGVTVAGRRHIDQLSPVPAL